MSRLRDWAAGVYHDLVPRPRRQELYRFLHRGRYRRLRTAVYPSAKGTYSLRHFDTLRAIFVHTPKAAGTSLALSIFGELPDHYTAADYIAVFGRRTFDAYFKFSFVRNPWDRLYSAYNFLRKGGWDEKDRAWSNLHLGGFSDFGDFVTRGLRRDEILTFTHFIPQHEFVCDRHGRLLVDYLGYFETIEDDYREICRRIGVESALAHTNRSTDFDYRSHYTDATRAIVAEVYRRDIEVFGYSFDGIHQRTIVTTTPH